MDKGLLCGIMADRGLDATSDALQTVLNRHQYLFLVEEILMSDELTSVFLVALVFLSPS